MTAHPPDVSERWEGAVRPILAALDESLGTDSILLVDARTGALIGSGVPEGAAAAVPSLVDSCVSSARRLASLVAGFEFTSLAHQGDESTILLREITGEWFLMVVLREITDAASDRLDAGVVELRRAAGSVQEARGGPGTAVAPGWGGDAEAEIDRLFDEGA